MFYDKRLRHKRLSVIKDYTCWDTQIHKRTSQLLDWIGRMEARSKRLLWFVSFNLRIVSTIGTVWWLILKTTTTTKKQGLSITSIFWRVKAHALNWVPLQQDNNDIFILMFVSRHSLFLCKCKLQAKCSAWSLSCGAG